MMRRMRFLPVLALALLLAACGAWQVPSNLNGNLPRKGSIVPDTNISLTPSLSIRLEKLMYWGTYASAAYLILDPLAPNWEIEEAAFPDQHYAMALHMKRYYSGGAGEARVVFHRRAKELVRLGGYAGYEVLDYTESIESSVLGAQRVAAGTIQLTKKSG